MVSIERSRCSIVLLRGGADTAAEVLGHLQISTATSWLGFRKEGKGARLQCPNASHELLQIKDALKCLEKNIPDLQKMGVVYMQVGALDGGKNASGGTVDELREQILAVALDRGFLAEPLPTDEFAFKKRLEKVWSQLQSWGRFFLRCIHSAGRAA